MGPRTMELVFSTCAVPGEGRARERARAGKVETLQRQMHFIDKATALYRAEADTPGGQGHIGGRGSDSH